MLYYAMLKVNLKVKIPYLQTCFVRNYKTLTLQDKKVLCELKMAV